MALSAPLPSAANAAAASSAAAAIGAMEGHVGMPLPSVRARIVHEETGEDITSCQIASSEPEPSSSSSSSSFTGSGELRLKGETLFLEYWRKPDATAESFDDDGWFRTGDVV